MNYFNFNSIYVKIVQICKNCKNEHDGSYGSGRFCSSKCARGFSTKEKRNEINEKVSEKLIGRKTRNYYSIQNNIKKSKIKKEYLNISPEERWKKIKEKRDATYNKKILNAEYSTLSFERLRKRIILEQKEKCNKCKLDKWLGNNMPLELEHIDGNHYNNERTNLEALCPNCHSLTPTWRGRNKNNINCGRISDEELLKTLVEKNFNMRQALLSFGLAAKGGNYNRCHKLKREYEEILNS